MKPTKRRSRRFRDPLRGHSPMAEGPFLLGQRARFQNGARVVVARTPGLHSAMLALYVRAGSRHERPEANGASHFVEHLVFRGSRGYPDSRAMNEAVEAAGGSMNAMTARDHTCFYTSLHPAGLETGIDVMVDLIRHPLLRDIEVERQVILEEILDEVDSRGRDVDPDNLVKRLAFPDHGLGQKNRRVAGERPLPGRGCAPRPPRASLHRRQRGPGGRRTGVLRGRRRAGGAAARRASTGQRAAGRPGPALARRPHAAVHRARRRAGGVLAGLSGRPRTPPRPRRGAGGPAHPRRWPLLPAPLRGGRAARPRLLHPREPGDLRGRGPLHLRGRLHAFAAGTGRRRRSSGWWPASGTASSPPRSSRG